MRNAVSFIGYGLVCGVLMTCFVLFEGVGRYIFSLGAIVVGFRFFKNHESKKVRIGFSVFVLFLALIGPVIYTALAMANGWYINPNFTKGIEQGA